MPIAIRILSGARRGEEILLDTTDFRVGGVPECEVYFDPRRDVAAQGRSARVRLRDDGWYVRPEGSSPVLLNHAPLDAESRIRSGDVLRMSDSGPDFVFTLTARPAEIANRQSPQKAPSHHPQPAASLHEPATPVAVEGVSEASAARGLEPIPESPEKRSAAGESGGAIASWDRLLNSREVVLLAIGAFVALLVLTAAVWFPFRDRFQVAGDNPQAKSEAIPTLPDPDVISTSQAAPPAPPGARPAGATIPTTAGKSDIAVEGPDPQPADPWARAQAEFGQAVFLVEMEIDGIKGTSSWPFCTASAIDDRTLLTSAREVFQLAAWSRQGRTIWATSPASGARHKIKDFRVHRDFVSLAAQQGDWIYANLGLLVADGPLPKTVRLASPKDLGALEEGMPVGCLGYTHDGSKRTRFDQLEAECRSGKVFRVSGLAERSPTLRLLEFKAKLPENLFGSPILNRQGSLIALYGEAAPPGEGIRDLHYAAVVDRGLLDAWITKGESGWVAPPDSSRMPGPSDRQQPPEDTAP